MTIEYSPMPCHDCSFLSISDSIPYPRNIAWFSKEKDKNTASSYTLWPYECRSLSESTTTSPWETKKHYELESQYIPTICPCGLS